MGLIMQLILKGREWEQLPTLLLSAGKKLDTIKLFRFVAWQINAEITCWEFTENLTFKETNLGFWLL